MEGSWEGGACTAASAEGKWRGMKGGKLRGGTGEVMHQWCCLCPLPIQYCCRVPLQRMAIKLSPPVPSTVL